MQIAHHCTCKPHFHFELAEKSEETKESEWDAAVSNNFVTAVISKAGFCAKIWAPPQNHENRDTLKTCKYSLTPHCDNRQSYAQTSSIRNVNDYIEAYADDEGSTTTDSFFTMDDQLVGQLASTFEFKTDDDAT